eukprot:13246864-Ditylum_brightwellii.AAC.1
MRRKGPSLQRTMTAWTVRARRSLPTSSASVCPARLGCTMPPCRLCATRGPPSSPQRPRPWTC